MTFDALTETYLEDVLYPGYARRIRMALEDFHAVTGRTMKILEAVRSFSRQRELFAKGRTSPGPSVRPSRPMGLIVTNAVAGLSVHHYGVASDCVFAGRDPYLALETKVEGERLWREFGRALERADLRWGGDWDGDGKTRLEGDADERTVDYPHNEFCYGMRVQDMLQLYRAGGIRLLWEKFDAKRGVPPGEGWASRHLPDPGP